MVIQTVYFHKIILLNLKTCKIHFWLTSTKEEIQSLVSCFLHHWTWHWQRMKLRFIFTYASRLFSFLKRKMIYPFSSQTKYLFNHG